MTREGGGGWKRERGGWKWRGYKARCRRKEEGVEIRNVIKVPPLDHVFDSFPIHGYALLRFFLYPRFFDYSSFSSATPGTLLFALEIFCGTRMGQGNQTATTLSLPLPPPPSFFSPFFFSIVYLAPPILSTSRSLSVAKFLITDPIEKIIGGGG